MKEKIVIIGANSFQNPLILKAKEMGYETHVFAWKTGDIGEKNADFFYPISITEKEKILEECKRIKPKGVVSIASDLAVPTVNYIANKLNLIANPIEASQICTNKYEMRKAFEKAGISVPKFMKISNCEDEYLKNIIFPVIVKPTDRSGSRGVTLVKVKENLKPALERAIENSFDNEAIIEEFIDGEEFSCECISYRGNHNYLTITKKFTTGAPNFIETGHIQPAGLTKSEEQKVKQEIFKALDALNIQNGPSHSEFKIDNKGNIRIIEIGARMGGDCIGSDLVKLSTGFDFLKLTLDIAVGNKPKLEKVAKTKIATIKFIFSKKDLDKLEKIKELYKDQLYYISEIQDLNHKIVDSSSRYGYYILQCDSIQQLNAIEEL